MALAKLTHSRAQLCPERAAYGYNSGPRCIAGTHRWVSASVAVSKEKNRRNMGSSRISTIGIYGLVPADNTW